MEEWGVIGFFILLFAPFLGRLHWIAGIATIAVGILVMVIAGGAITGSLGVAGVVLCASGFVTNKITGDFEITDLFSYISGVILLILAIVVAM
jgi:hypothetical protein